MEDNQDITIPVDAYLDLLHRSDTLDHLLELIDASVVYHGYNDVGNELVRILRLIV